MLTTKLSILRRRRPPLLHFFSRYSSSFSHSPLVSSSLRHRHRHHHDNIPGCSRELLRHSPPSCLSFSRRFSADPGDPESDEPPLPIEATESDEPFLPVEAAETDEPFLAVQAVISMLDYYHDVTGFPWWIVISTSTLAMRLALLPISVLQLKKLRRWVIISSSTVVMRLAIFPLVVLQLKKLKMIAELLPQLPPPFPPPLSGRNLKDQITLFWKEKEAAGCPSVFWFFSSFAVQCPCFFLWLMSVRTMSLNHHPSFDSGGVLWFQNLTEYPHGVLGPVLPLCIAGLHFANVQLSVRKSSLAHLPNTLKLLTKLYKVYLQLLTLPILIATFNVPQGSLIYWLTNSTLSLTQLLCLRNPNVLEYLGLPEMNASAIAPTFIKKGSSGIANIVIQTKEGEILAQTLSPEDLVSYSIEVLGGGNEDAAVALLRLALEKDPGHSRALLIMGQTLLRTKEYAEAAECLEKAISKLLITGNATEVGEINLLILSSQWAGIANMHQGKMKEGVEHLERIGEMEEPRDAKCRASYYEGLVILSSALSIVGRKGEALKYLQKAATYNPAYNEYVSQLQDDTKEFASDLSNVGRY